MGTIECQEHKQPLFRCNHTPDRSEVIAKHRNRGLSYLSLKEGGSSRKFGRRKMVVGY